MSEMMRLNEITRDASICSNLKQTVKISAWSVPFWVVGCRAW